LKFRKLFVFCSLFLILGLYQNCGANWKVADLGASSTAASSTNQPDAGTPPDIIGSTPTTTIPPVVGSPTTTLPAMVGRDLSADKTKFFGSSRCAGSGLQLCEDFESGTVSASWSVIGNLTVESGQSARGSKAMHIKGNGDFYSFIKETVTFPAVNNTYYGRVFVRYVALPTKAEITKGYDHWVLATAGGSGGRGSINVDGQWFGAHYFSAGTYDPSFTGDWLRPAYDKTAGQTPVSMNEWICVEWMHDGQNNEIKMWRDGVENTAIGASLKNHPGNQNVDFVLPKFTNVQIGWSDQWHIAGGNREVWIDEIAIDPARIGCIH
jgi:hypothetical protein